MSTMGHISLQETESCQHFSMMCVLMSYISYFLSFPSSQCQFFGRWRIYFKNVIFVLWTHHTCLSFVNNCASMASALIYLEISKSFQALHKIKMIIISNDYFYWNLFWRRILLLKTILVRSGSTFLRIQSFA